MDAQAPQDDTIGMAARLRSIMAGSIGNLIEWYDFYVYSAFSLYFAKAFFPGTDATAQYLNTALIFALGFLIRPVGGWVIGDYADRRGRRAALLLSVGLMCAGSLMIAVTPTFAQAGALAPAILVFARLLQGFSLGAEYGTSATYLSEVATARRRGFYASFQYVTLIAGQVLATLTLLVLQRFVLTADELGAWGWRIPFVIGAALAVLGLFARRGMMETEAFRRDAAQAVRRRPLRELARHRRAVLTVVGLTLGGTLAFYTYTVYMQKYLVVTVGLTKDEATTVSLASLTIYMLLQPVIGLISDVVGRRPVLMAFGIFGTIFTYPILSALAATHDEFSAFLLALAALVIVSGYTAINAVVKAELFPTAVRALGVGLPYALTVSLFGGTAEYLGLWFKDIGHETWFYWYVTAGIFVSLLVYTFTPDTRRTSRFN